MRFSLINISNQVIPNTPTIYYYLLFQLNVNNYEKGQVSILVIRPQIRLHFFFPLFTQFYLTAREGRAAKFVF